MLAVSAISRLLMNRWHQTYGAASKKILYNCACVLVDVGRLRCICLRHHAIYLGCVTVPSNRVIWIYEFAAL